MSTNTPAAQKVILTRRVLLTGLIVILSIAVTASFQLMPTDHTIVHCLYSLTCVGNNFVCRSPFL